jgi:hypothetical protein
MKHRTRAVAPELRTARRPARRLAARFLLALAAAGALPAHAMEIQVPVLPSERATSGALAQRPAAVAGVPTSSASPGNDAAAERRGASATAPAGSAPAVASPGRRLPEPRTWALFGVGLLAVLMMARRQRQQHD